MHFIKALALDVMITGLTLAAPTLDEKLLQEPAAGTPTSTARISLLAKPRPIIKNAKVGVRPYFLVNNMTDSLLKRRLQNCSDGPFSTTDFALSHRGAALQFPEHTVQGRWYLLPRALHS